MSYQQQQQQQQFLPFSLVSSSNNLRFTGHQPTVFTKAPTAPAIRRWQD